MSFHFIERNHQSNSNKKKKQTIIIGVVVGLVALIVTILATVCTFILRKNKTKNEVNTFDAQSNDLPVTSIVSTVQHFSNPLYGEDIHDSRDSFNECV